MQKVQIVESSQKGKFRLIANPSEAYSVGVIMERSEMTELFYQMKDLLEQPDALVSAIAPPSDESVSAEQK